MLKNSFIVMFATLISRVLGLVRTTIVAYYFGSNYLTDAYNSAFRITNFFRQLLGEGALGSVFIPVYNEKEKLEGKERGKELIFSVLNIITIFTLIVTILMMVFSVWIIKATVYGYNVETQKLTVILFNIMAFYFVFIGLGSMLSAILNNFKVYFWPAFMSVMFNLSMIVIPMLLQKQFGIYSLAIGTLVGGILEFVVLLPSFIRIVKRYSFKINLKDPYLKKIFILLTPMMVGVMSRQVNTVVDTFFASFLPDGSVTALNNASLLYNLPLGLFGTSVATVIFPMMSRAKENGDLETVKTQIEDGLKFLIFFMIPSIFAMTFFASDIVRIVLHHGKFTENAVRITAETLFCYSLGLYFFTGIYLMSRCFYIMKNTKDPVKFSVISITVNTILCPILVMNFKHMGIATATVIASLLNFAQLYYYFNKKYIKLNHMKVINLFIFTAVVSIIAVCGTLLVAMKYNNPIIKLAVFSAIYLLLCIKPLLSNKKIRMKIKEKLLKK